MSWRRMLPLAVLAVLVGAIAFFLAPRSRWRRGLKKEFLIADPVKTPPWQELIRCNTPDDLPVHVPLLIAQGRNDGLILPAITRDYAARFCKAGGSASLLEMTAGHLDIATLSAAAAVEWMADRLTRKPLASSCAALQKFSSG